MCHGSIDPKFLMREVEDRVRTAAPAPSNEASPGSLPPELMGGWRGAWARLAALFPRRFREHGAS